MTARPVAESRERLWPARVPGTGGEARSSQHRVGAGRGARVECPFGEGGGILDLPVAQVRVDHAVAEPRVVGQQPRRELPRLGARTETRAQMDIGDAGDREAEVAA